LPSPREAPGKTTRTILPFDHRRCFFPVALKRYLEGVVEKLRIGVAGRLREVMEQSV